MGVTLAQSGRADLAAALDDAASAAVQAVEVLRRYAPASDLQWYGVDDPAALPVGAADRALLSAHETLLHRPLERTVVCPDCGEWTTLPLGRRDVGENSACCAWCGPGVGVREPSYLDLLAAGGDAEALVARCSIGTGATLDDLGRIEGSLSGPLRSTCVGCGTELVDDVDVMSLVLEALGELRSTVDREVHLLATAYGWDPITIDSLSDDRRQRLADLVAGEL